MARVDVTPVYENTTMQAYYNNENVYYNNENVLKVYYIAPIEDYVLHSTSYDTYVRDENGEDTDEILLGYIPYPAYVSVPANYDFTANPKQIFAVPADTVPENQIFNNGNDHEVM